jgi:cytoskeletal protein RodZ
MTVFRGKPMDFGHYLKAVREEHHVTLEAVSSSTKIKRQLWIDLEANDLRRWPTHRVYRHGYVRSYAEAVGADPDEVLARFDAEFADEKPAPAAPAPPIESRSRPLALGRNAIAFAITTAVLVGIGLNMTDKRENAVAASSPTPGTAQEFKRTSVPPGPRASGSAVESSSGVAPGNSGTSGADVPAMDVEGEIRVVSNPANAWVTINGNGFGTTPLRVRYLPMGSYTVRVIQAGYKAGQTQVMLSTSQPNRSLNLVLRENAAGPGEARPGEKAGAAR